MIEDLPFRDVAAALGISEDAAKKRVHRGLRTLRARLSTSPSAPLTAPGPRGHNVR